ncbi:hypothetical protein CBR_g6661 [Chara braunii]|uniref:Protein kinase domain-containing protein n=1 Tax=Chara braunii TaxID=69332 RepID=A0A388KKP5_CHABU|nr:hypothetical protein CBR_g6661 [Chara braunii]|eukprot:GBG70533.1 hypothetical protein CBR_g6661 [Chara braunii]
MGQGELEELRRQIDDMIDRGWIRPSEYEFGAPVLFVPKKGGKLRTCIDYRGLNRITRKNAYPLPRIDDLLDAAGGCKVFSKIDLKSGYHQIEVDPSDQHKIAFKTRDGLYEFIVMHFGLTNAPATFQCLMDKVLRDQLNRFVVVYLDDNLIFSKSMEEHVKHLEEVLQVLKEAQLHLNLEKSEFGRDNVIYLGHRLSANGLEPEATKVEVIRNWPQSANVRELRSFLGLASCYRKILSNNNLSGNVSAFNDFQDLRYLDLRGNFFRVMNFEESMPNLTHLNIARNELTHVTLDKLTGLQELSLMKNDLSGNFSSVFQKRNLRKLDIRLNSFSGVVPEDMLNMTWFKPGNCKLQGERKADNKEAPFEEVPEGEDPCRSNNRLKLALGAAAGVIGALLLGCAAFAVFYFLVNEKPRGKDSSSLPRSNSSHEGTGFLRRQKLHDVGFPREFDIREVEAATETATTTLLGKGAFGDVFEATLDGSRVVIKFRAKGTTSLLPEFQRDVKKLGSYNHKNLVRVLGYCDDKEYQALVIEWMPNGSLEYYLYGSRTESPLDWRTRLKVLAGAASGIEFLHGGDYRQICYSVSPLIHCDIKSSNILLGDQFEAKVADFGYFKPKLFGDKFHSDLRYFQGYLDPEYLSNDQKNELDKKSDVFSFGVVILETVTGRPPIDTFGGHEPMTIAHWVRNRKNDGNLKDIVDPRLPEGSYLIDVVKNVVEVALECLNASSSVRPTIKSVRRSLEEAYKTESRAGNSMSLELPSVETQPSGHISR